MMEKLYKPPEITKSLWQQVHTTPGWCIDTWMLGWYTFFISLPFFLPPFSFSPLQKPHFSPSPIFSLSFT
jgi:hypothetical protein